MKAQQVSMFAMLDAYETPEIPTEEQKAGTKGWIIEESGTFLVKYGNSHNYRGVCTRPVILERDTERDPEAFSGWFQAGRTTKGPYHGWYGPYNRIFRERPTWNDCLKFMRETKLEGEPDEVEYYEIIGDFRDEKHEY